MKLTKGQIKWLRKLRDGQNRRPYGDNFRVFDRMMAKFVHMELARSTGHNGEFEITDKGVRALPVEP